MRIGSPAYGFAAQVEWGHPVTRIRLDCNARLKIEDFAEEITQKVGEPLEREKVTESLKKLYSTGRFKELKADVERDGNGVELVFVGQAIFFAGVVRVEGTPKTIDPKTLADASHLHLGQPLSEQDLGEAQKRVAAVLAENGYYEGQTTRRLIPDLETEEMEIFFAVVPGQPARLSRAEFEGHTVFPSERLARVAHWSAGRHLTPARIDRGLRQIHKFYVEHSRLQERADIQERIYDPKTRTEKLLVHVEAGPEIKVRLEGARMARSKLKQILPVFRDGLLDEAALERSQQVLEDYFQRQGFFSATAKGQRAERANPKAIEITFEAKLGERKVFAGYDFRGNHSVATRDLEAVIIEEASLDSATPRVFSQELVGRYVDALKYVYDSNGFLEARVTSRLQAHLSQSADTFSVTFDIEEGPRTKVRCLGIRGIERKTELELWPLLSAKPGGPYSPTLAQADRDQILNYLTDRGYTRASVGLRATPPSKAHTVDLEYDIQPGPQETVERVVILGNQHTRPGVIRRELAVRKGGPLRQSEVLKSQQRLYELGIFNQVQISTQDTERPQTEKTVLVNVEEARRWTVGYGGGAEVQRLGSDQPQGQLRASPRLSLELTRINLAGRAQTVSLGGRLSTLERGGSFSYLITPLPTISNIKLRLNALADRSRDVLTFAAEREEASLSVERRYSPATLIVGRYSYRRVLVDPSTLRISPDAIPLFSRPARIGMLGGSIVNDSRDNPADASEGSYTLADAGVSWQALGSQANFLRFSGQNATYHRLGPRLVFARNARFQVESPYGSAEARAQGIPLPERFFMGGSESHRGFSINQAGPRDLVTGFPVGGNALFFNSLELRLPFKENRFGLVAFQDFGNVYSTIRKMRLLKVTQSSPTDFDYTVHAVGLGLRYKTPVGPVRFDVGFNLNPPRFMGQVPQGVEVRRLSPFQFFLSIGQSF